MRTLPNVGYLTEASSPPLVKGLWRTNRTNANNQKFQVVDEWQSAITQWQASPDR